ncbi:helix-turn-helix transcriptional regulator [Glaciecola sp. KUL10]|jgi:putative transcriptional regulator|uniref:helix-turn-helix transcriptional regulator n=1 Tax=Glaciecola sp. (strain KUL10) TaxID=2161813 RepID=UPI000D78C674|nr:helix-turn-helix transcriptional regulator [Glaciecola sp. KUL10]GBL05023.1 transcriptional regulator [Glaciecola sp. KUL10]
MSYHLTNVLALKRAEKGLSQQELAASIGVSRKTISTVETGRFTPSVIIALSLAKFFEVAVEDLFELRAAEGDSE